MRFGHPWGKKHRHMETIERWLTCQHWNFNPVTRNNTWAAGLKNCRQRDGRPAKLTIDHRVPFDYVEGIWMKTWELVPPKTATGPFRTRFVNAKR